MLHELRVIFVTEAEQDAGEMARALKVGGYGVTYERVDSSPAMHAALARGKWDVVISSCRHASFTSYHALMALKNEGVDTPLILVADGDSGALAAATMQAGATDYLLRTELGRLPVVVERAMRERLMDAAHGTPDRILRRAEELAARLDKVLDNASNEIYFYDSVTLNFIQVNQGAQRNLGYSMVELAQRTPVDVKPEFTERDFLAVLEPLRAGDTDQIVLHTLHRRRDGSTYPVETRIQYSRSEAPPVFVEISQDITERVRIESGLRDRLEQLQAIYRVSAAVSRSAAMEEIYEEAMAALQRSLKADRVGLLTYDADGVMRFKAWRGVSDEYRAAVEGHSPWSRDAVDPRPIVVEDALEDGSVAPFREALRREGIRALAFVPLGAPGQLMGKIMLYHDAPRRIDRDALQLAQAIATHVAFALDRKRAVEAIRESEERYRALVEGVRDYALFAISPEGRVQSWNAGTERLFGYSEEEVLGRPVHHFYPLEEGEEAAQAHLRVAATEHRHEYEGYRVRKDGSRIWAHVVLTALRDEDGTLLGFSKLVRDLTDRKRAEEELEASRQQLAMSEKLRALGTLVSGVAHEIRTPLTYVANNLFLLSRHLERASQTDPSIEPLRKEIIEYSRAALEGVDRINHLVKNLRQSARLDPGRRTREGLESVVGQAVDLFRATQRGHVTVETDLAATPAVEVAREQLQQVVLNLLTNAAEAMPKGGTIRVATRAAPGGATFSVEDDGPGITPGIEARMFDPFFTTKAEGTGLGLPISKRIVEAHGGTMAYETAPGKGTRFTVFVPTLAGGPRSGE